MPALVPPSPTPSIHIIPEYDIYAYTSNLISTYSMKPSLCVCTYVLYTVAYTNTAQAIVVQFTVYVQGRKTEHRASRYSFVDFISSSKLFKVKEDTDSH